MKNILTLVFGFIAFGLTAQTIPTITETSLPNAGDTLRFSQALDVGLIDIEAASGVENEWDFSAWVADNTTSEVYLEASAGSAAAAFPAANMVLVRTGTETYLQNDGSNIFAIGEYTAIDFLGQELPFPYSPAFLQISTPMTIGTAFDSESENYFAISGDQLPAAITDSIPLTIDSIRVLSSYERSVNAFAAGTLTVGNMTDHPVLLVKEELSTTISIEALVPFFGWTDVSAFVDLPGTGTPQISTSYNFYSENEVGAVLQLSGNDALGYTAQWSNLTTVSTRDWYIGSTAGFRQNPSSINAIFDYKDLPNSDYQLDVFSLNGKLVTTTSFAANGTGSVELNLPQNGMYVFRFTDLIEKRQTSGKLIVE